MHFIQADATRIPLADQSVSLVFTSPPYMSARTYGISAQRDAADWVEWMLTVVTELTRVCRGLVLVNCGGVTKDRTYWPGCEGLAWEWWKRGLGSLWRPAYWHRVGIPGSGGKQWLRADIEYVIPFKRNTDWLDWADNTANGHPPKWAPGGDMSHRLSDGARVNQWGGRSTSGKTRRPSGERQASGRPSHEQGRRVPRGHANGDIKQSNSYVPPVLANPGNLVQGIKVGGGLMGHPLAHENEAPFPQQLAEWFIRGWCSPGGWVLDPFSGSGTTVAAAAALGRNGIGCDIRMSQCELGRRRCAEVATNLFS